MHDVHDVIIMCDGKEKKYIQKKKKKRKTNTYTKKETKLRIQKQIIKNQTKQLL